MNAILNTRLTDTLERDLLAKAMEAQFRFQPVHTVGKLIFAFATMIAEARVQTNAREMI